MKKIILGILIILSGFCLLSCSSKANTKEIERDASDLVNALVEKGMPIGKIIVYDEETDENGLLGRPNQYTSKVNFEDTNCEQFDIESDPVGGSIEVFKNKKDAKKRYDYIESLSDGISLFQQYLYLHDTVLLRIDFDVTPASAESYNETLIQILGE